MSILSDADIAEIKRAAKGIETSESPEKVRSSEIHIGAYRVLALTLGRPWCDQHLRPLGKGNSGFLKRSLATPEDSLKHADRVIHLAEYVNRLQGVPNFDRKIADLRTKGLEETFYELRVAASLLGRHRLVEFVAPSGLKGADYDLVARIGDQLIHTEVKCVTDEPAYAVSKIRNPLKKAAKQLPASGPGAIFLMLNSEWIMLSGFRGDSESVVSEILRNNTRINAIFFHWETWSSQAPFRRDLMLHVFTSNSPRTPVALIRKLIRPAVLPPTGTTQYINVTYI